jgi:endonuclease/exonuclease/phosphatase family metal-dependent hydrolase
MVSRTLVALLVVSLAIGAVVLASGRRSTLRLATWNMEWLVSPATAQAARLACRAQRRATLPCDVASSIRRDTADFARLAAHVRKLDADVIAFQEVEDAATARRVFRGYIICMLQGTGVQHVGFALRPHVRHHCGPPVQSVAGTARGRPGLALTLQVEGLPQIEVLAVHLKSGCSTQELDSELPACQLLLSQVTALGEWIAARAARQAPFIVLGDFNRASLPSGTDRFWQLLDPTAFVAAASALAFTNCTFGQPYSAYIDHILVARSLSPWLPAQPYARTPFSASDAARHLLSDHCPVSVSLQKYVHSLAVTSLPTR